MHKYVRTYVRTYLHKLFMYVTYKVSTLNHSTVDITHMEDIAAFHTQNLHLTHLTWFSDGLQTNCKTCVCSFFLHIHALYTYISFSLHPYVPCGQECCLLCPPDLCSLSTLQSVSERSKAPGVLEREERSTTERSASSGTTKSCSLSCGVIRQCEAYSFSNKDALTL